MSVHAFPITIGIMNVEAVMGMTWENFLSVCRAKGIRILMPTEGIQIVFTQHVIDIFDEEDIDDTSLGGDSRVET